MIHQDESNGSSSPLICDSDKDSQFPDLNDDYCIKRESRQQSTLRILIGLVVFLSIVCTALGVTTLWLSRRPNDIFYMPEVRAEVIHTPGITPPISGPEFTRKTVLFQKNETFMGEKSKAYSAWHKLLNRWISDGLATDSMSGGLHGRITFDNMPGEIYGVSAYHQLHCVWMLQQAVDMAVKETRPEAAIEKHMFHCAEYLRQSVMCFADPTLERKYKGVLGAFGANNTHVCGDWDKLTDWSDDHIYIPPVVNSE